MALTCVSYTQSLRCLLLACAGGCCTSSPSATHIQLPAALYPLDTIKTRLQLMIKGQGLKSLWQSGGGRNLYAGMWGNLAGVAPASAIFMGFYEPIKAQIQERVSPERSAWHCAFACADHLYPLLCHERFSRPRAGIHPRAPHAVPTRASPCNHGHPALAFVVAHAFLLQEVASQQAVSCGRWRHPGELPCSMPALCQQGPGGVISCNQHEYSA